MSTFYQKIPGPFLRDPATNKLTEQWSSPELEALQEADWFFTEKIDGTNIRIIWDGYRVSFGGRTDNAQIPVPLFEYLQATYGTPEREQLFEQKFGTANVVLYGEGYGPKIQSGGKYRQDTAVILFDVTVEGMYLQRHNVIDVAEYFGVEVVGLYGKGSLLDGIEWVRKGVKSAHGDFTAEGLVGITETGLLTRRGERVIVKLKGRDLESSDSSSTGGEL